MCRDDKSGRHVSQGGLQRAFPEVPLAALLEGSRDPQLESHGPQQAWRAVKMGRQVQAIWNEASARVGGNARGAWVAVGTACPVYLAFVQTPNTASCPSLSRLLHSHTELPQGLVSHPGHLWAQNSLLTGSTSSRH